MLAKPQNIFADIPANISAEVFEDLIKTDHVRIERIISKGLADNGLDTNGEWYDQSEHEWVIVLKGHAKLRFEHDPELTELKQGSYINIPAGVKHKVEWISPDEETIWLAIFYQ